MGASAWIIALAALSSVGQAIHPADKTTQNEVFERWWDAKFEWKFSNLPTEGSVEDFRVPYSGYIYPDTAGGTTSALRKYDRAFNGGRSSAVSWERWDTTAYKERSQGLFGGGVFGVMRIPYWHGHCNGWSAAAIRHAEPQKSVVRNGVEFTPADIKGLLAEVYMYNDTALIAGYERTLNAGLLHVILANWVGRGSYPLGMEADPGEEKWNYPMYAFASSHAMRSGNRVEVKTNIAYAKDSDGEYQESPRIKRVKYFHYQLQLNDAGEIMGGSFYRDSAIIDMLWVPLQPKQAGRPGNERGNPHINVDQILAIWRESVPQETRMKWFTVDPATADRIPSTIRALDDNASAGATDETAVDVPSASAETSADSPESTTVRVTDADRQAESSSDEGTTSEDVPSAASPQAENEDESEEPGPVVTLVDPEGAANLGVRGSQTVSGLEG